MKTIIAGLLVFTSMAANQGYADPVCSSIGHLAETIIEFRQDNLPKGALFILFAEHPAFVDEDLQEAAKEITDRAYELSIPSSEDAKAIQTKVFSKQIEAVCVSNQSQ